MSHNDQRLVQSSPNAAAVLSTPMSQTLASHTKRPTSDAASVRAASIYSSGSTDGRTAAAPAIISAAYPTVPVNHSARARPPPELKTVHTYSGATGKLLVQLHTPPQALPTYMGGSKARGRGSIVGRIILHCTEKDRANEVRVKLKAVVSVQVPKASQATDGEMPTFAGLTPSETSTSSREQVLLSIEDRLKASDALFRTSEQAAPKPNTSGKLDNAGIYEWKFKFDIPESGTGKNTLPLGFPGVGANYPSSYVLESDKRHKGAIEEWASVKWYIKVTVGRPGLFRSNDRLLVPFIYLPPPPDKISSTIIQRQALSMQIQRMVHTIHGPVVLPKDLAEPASRWHTEYFPLNQASLGQNTKRSLVDKLFGMNKPKEERWAISLPGKPLAVFPLRSTIPFVLTLVHSAGMPLVVHPEVYLVQKVHLRARSSAAHTQYISYAKVLASPATKSGMQQWFGWIQFPSWCSPSFDTQLLGLEYFVQVKPLNIPNAHTLCTIPIGLYCAPPRLVQARELARSQSISRPAHQASGAAGRVPSGGAGPAARRPFDAASIASSDTAQTMSPSAATAPTAAPLRSLQSSRQPSMSSLHRTTAPPPWAVTPVPADPHAAGVAGIGRMHLTNPDASAAASQPQTPPRTVPPMPATGASLTSPTSSTPSHAPVPTSEVLQNPHDAASPPPLPYRENPGVSTVSLPLREPTMPQPSGHEGAASADTGIHDAGPLTAEQEQAWTMDILANAFDDDGGDAFELPPSYFEAVGIEDHDE